MAEANVREKQKLRDIQTKMKIVKSLLKAWANKADVYMQPEYLIYEIAKGHITQSILDFYLLKFKVDRYKTFHDYEKLLTFKNDKTTEPDVIDTTIRDMILKCYSYEEILLNKKSILKEFRKKKLLIDQQEVENVLRLRGYIWKKIPDSSKGIIVEDPENSFNRMEYIHKIQQFRQPGINIVYIEDKIITSVGDIYNNFDAKIKSGIWIHLAVSSTMGVLSRKFFDVRTVPADDRHKFTLILNWILDDVLPQLSTSSAIVLDEKPYYSISYDNIPSEFSFKSDMIKWLEKNNIPYNTKMHSAELHELIEASRHNFLDKACDIEKNLSAYGHKTLLRPRKMFYDHFVDDYMKLVLKKACLQGFGNFVELFDHFLSSTPIGHWKYIEKGIIESEKQILAEEISLDDILENLFLHLQKKDENKLEYLTGCDFAIDEIRLAKVLQI